MLFRSPEVLYKLTADEFQQSWTADEEWLKKYQTEHQMLSEGAKEIEFPTAKWVSDSEFTPEERKNKNLLSKFVEPFSDCS